ncbi:MAG TPA: hypothetical protein DC058_02550 [Planctomycetaceae bacterium]|nr:hypothetical protein [Planctomycetaceae bacterium]
MPFSGPGGLKSGIAQKFVTRFKTHETCFVYSMFGVESVNEEFSLRRKWDRSASAGFAGLRR